MPKIPRFKEQAQEESGIEENNSGTDSSDGVPAGKLVGGGYFTVGSDGVYFKGRSTKGKPHWEWVCSPLFINAHIRDSKGENWGRLVTVLDPDGNEHELTLPMEALSGDAREIRGALLSAGLRFGVGKSARERLSRYLIECDPECRVVCVPKIGWHGDQFVLPNLTIGESDDERTVFQPGGVIEQHFATSGSLDDWCEHVGRPCVGNSRPAFAVCCAFGAPMLTLTGEDGGGFHFRGGSSSGKSTVLIVAGSVWGGGGRLGFCNSWRSTANALEAVAEGQNDALLVLDELGQSDAREAGDIAYFLANGSGKGRMSRTAILKRSASWRLLFLSSGEISPSEHIEAGGNRARGGHQVRLVDVAADAGTGLGVFENLHGAANGDSFSRQLSEAARQYYGTPIREFLEFITSYRERAVQFVQARRDEFVSQHVPAGSSGEVFRVARLFGLVAGSGELAAKIGVLPWPKGESTRAAAKCFEAWIKTRGGKGGSDLAHGIRHVRHFLQSESARFWDIENDERRPLKLVGYKHLVRKRETRYCVLPIVFEREACGGYDYRRVAQELKRTGFLVTENGRLQCKTPKLADGTRPRTYVIRGAFIEEDEVE